MTRFMLLPGLHRTRIDSATIQLGVDPETALLLESPRPQVSELLDRLETAMTEKQYYGAARSLGLDDVDAGGLLRLLRHGRLLIDPAAFRSRDAAADRRAQHHSETAALSLRRTDCPAELMSRRERRRIWVSGETDMVTEFTELLYRSGVGAVAAPGRRGGPPDLAVLLDPRQPADLVARSHARRDLPYLMVTTMDGAVNVGPLVIPGRTACAACVEHHITDVVPNWRRNGAAPAPLEAALRGLAVATAACQALQYLDGVTGQIESATIQLRAPFGLRHREWTPHPACGCAPAIADRADRVRYVPAS
ncbi:hypothetical protein LX16_0844 [Stackebrandtia albiflava]|uniref:Bacteriocin biosynthesis cyclodehydratase domain-containing protein n=1 Tax=Stackebrandtia albiflava TaxID=406432 RepID=A0A562VBA1_9ACTN|nr:hypothetical protein [Stackebrandtia albiflava]TWJ15145.1 hypothetical protein LX16_0844 [Stackebrandtia albiflava]